MSHFTQCDKDTNLTLAKITKITLFLPPLFNVKGSGNLWAQLELSKWAHSM